MRVRIVPGCDEGLSNAAVANKLQITGAEVCKRRGRRSDPRQNPTLSKRISGGNLESNLTHKRNRKRPIWSPSYQSANDRDPKNYYGELMWSTGAYITWARCSVILSRTGRFSPKRSAGSKISALIRKSVRVDPST